MSLPLDPKVCAELEQRVPSGLPRPRLLLLRSLRPPRAAGSLAADLLALVGAEPFRTTPDARRSGVLGVLDFSKTWTPALVAPPEGGSEGFLPTWEEVLEFDPQLVLLSLEPRERGRGIQDWMSVDGWNRLEAARSGRVLLAEEGLCRPGRDLTDGLRDLQDLMGSLFWGWPRKSRTDEGQNREGFGRGKT